LSIDGELAAKVAGEDLARGCNLSMIAGPITEQGRQVLKLVFQKNNAYFNRWRDIQLYTFPDWAQGAENETRRAAELTRLDQLIAQTETQIDNERKPKSRHFELKPATP
jgi:hypothetical protein